MLKQWNKSLIVGLVTLSMLSMSCAAEEGFSNTANETTQDKQTVVGESAAVLVPLVAGMLIVCARVDSCARVMYPTFPFTQEVDTSSFGRAVADLWKQGTAQLRRLKDFLKEKLVSGMEGKTAERVYNECIAQCVALYGSQTAPDDETPTEAHERKEKKQTCNAKCVQEFQMNTLQ